MANLCLLVVIFDITYNNRKIKRQIEDLVGRPYSFIERIKLRGIGTSKMQIIEAAPEIDKLLKVSSSTAYCYLEIRTKGLIVGFQSQLKILALPIPFQQLSIYYNSGLLSVYGNQLFLKMRPPFNGVVDKRFLKKVLLLKSNYLKELNFLNQ